MPVDVVTEAVIRPPARRGRRVRQQSEQRAPVVCEMTLRNPGEPSGFGKVAAPLMARAMRRANRKDPERLKSTLEERPR
jgi:hypothetical protein